MVKLISCIVLLSSLLMAAPSGHADDEAKIINKYDLNGNLVTGDGRYYEYNDANQLVRVRQGDTVGGPVIAEYFYDSSGQRVKKIENGVVTYYVGKHFETQKMQQETQAGGVSKVNTSYYFGEGGERVARKDPTGNIFYYHLDHLDGINAVTDSAGTLVSRTDYLPFGDVRSGSTGTEKYSYTGKEKDKTDLYYFEARYNSPEFRHFTQADIADPDYSDPQDLNRYAYVGNNPLSYVDYDGFKKKKKARLSKREKWMIAHGVDPDHDKTPLKQAKNLYKAGKKYTSSVQSKSKIAGNSPNSLFLSPQNEYAPANSPNTAKSDNYKNAKLRQIQYMYATSAAYAEESAYWDAWANTLEGVHGALNASLSLLTGDIPGVTGSILDMGSTLARAMGHGTVATTLSLGATGIEIYNLFDYGSKFSNILDGRTAQARALDLSVTKDIFSKTMPKTTKAAIDIGSGFIGLVNDLVMEAYDLSN